MALFRPRGRLPMDSVDLEDRSSTWLVDGENPNDVVVLRSGDLNPKVLEDRSSP